MPTQVTCMSAQHLHPVCREVYTFSEEDDEWEHALLVFKKVFDYVFEWLNLATNVHIFQWKNSHKGGEQMFAWKAGNPWWYKPCVDDVTGLIIGAEYNAQKTVSGVPAMGMACVMPIGINYVMFVNLFATNAVKTPQIHSWWYKDIARIDPA